MAKRKEETVKHSPHEKTKKKSKKIRRDGVDASGAGKLHDMSKGNIKKKKNEDRSSKTRKRKEGGFDVSIDQLKEKIKIHPKEHCEVSVVQDEAIAVERGFSEPKKLKKNKGRKVHGMPKEEEEKMQDKKLKKKKRKASDATKEGENIQGKKHKEKKTEEVNMGEEGERKEAEKVEADFDDVLYMSSGDEDCSKGMKKWVTEYYQRIPGLEVLNQRTDQFLIDHDKRLEEEREEREARAAEGGWTVVTHQKGRKKNVENETGTAVGSVSQVVVEEYLSRKKPKELKDFYRFQKREAQRNEILTLQSKFEQDKKRIQQLRAARKFRPY